MHAESTRKPFTVQLTIAKDCNFQNGYLELREKKKIARLLKMEKKNPTSKTHVIFAPSSAHDWFIFLP